MGSGSSARAERRGFGRWLAAIAGAALAMQGSASRAANAPPQVLTFSCAGQIVSGDPIPTVGRTIAFKVAMPFGDGAFLALSSPDQNSVQRLVYGSEVLAGTIGIGSAPADEMVWTRATSRTGGLVGFTIDAGGDIVTLAIRAAPKGSGERPFDLLATAAGAAYRGSCH